MSRDLTVPEMCALYHQEEDYAKWLLEEAQRTIVRDSGRRDEIQALLEETLRVAVNARNLRYDVQRHYEESGIDTDVGHDRAIDWVDNNLIAPATQLLYRYRHRAAPDDDRSESRCRPRGHGQHYHRPRRSLSAVGLFGDDCEPARACMIDPGNAQQAYFFVDVAAVVINVSPGGTGDSIVQQPTLIIRHWSCLIAAHIFTVDAALQNPDNKHEVYFFSGEVYALVDIFKDQIVAGPKPITSGWTSLREAGFKIIDAVLPHPQNSHEAYFFSDKMYALVRYRPGELGDHIVNGPKMIAEEWPSLRAAGFGYVDSVIVNPADSLAGEAYFFCGSEYVLVSIRPGGNSDSIINGPKPVSTEWPSLRKALFY